MTTWTVTPPASTTWTPTPIILLAENGDSLSLETGDILCAESDQGDVLQIWAVTPPTSGTVWTPQ